MQHFKYVNQTHSMYPLPLQHTHTHTQRLKKKEKERKKMKKKNRINKVPPQMYIFYCRFYVYLVNTKNCSPHNNLSKIPESITTIAAAGAATLELLLLSMHFFQYIVTVKKTQDSEPTIFRPFLHYREVRSDLYCTSYFLVYSCNLLSPLYLDLVHQISDFYCLLV